MPKRVVITGLGVISPIGDNIKEFWNALLAGKGGASHLTAFDPTPFTCHIAAEIKDFDPAKHDIKPKEQRRMDRFVQFGLAAAREAVKNSNLDLSKEDLTRVGAVVGSGIGGLHTIESEYGQYLKLGSEKGPSRITPFLIPMLIVNMASGQISISLGLKGPNSCVATACATGNHAIGDAYRIIERGEADVMLAGGAEGAITPMGFGGFCALRALTLRNDDPERACRPFDKERDGFLMGEGAGIIILEELEHAKKRGANIYCEMAGYGMSADAYHMTAPNPDGDGAKRCMEECLKSGKLSLDKVDYINAHGTSTVLNDKVETLAIKNVFGSSAKKLAVSSTKSMTGHMLGAAGGAEAIICALAIKEGVIPPTINYKTPDPECDLDYVPNEARKKDVKIAITNSLGFGGHNATLALRKF